MPVYSLSEGEGPLVVSMPHAGVLIPDEIAERMSEAGRSVPETDWHIPRLYNFLDELRIPRIQAVFSRYVADLNRAPDGGRLYPGARETELCPTTTFDDLPIYQEGKEPGAAEIEARRRDYWQPYHLGLAQLLLQVKDRYGVAVLLDLHSIRSRVPRFFDGQLPDISLGSRDGASCHPELLRQMARVADETGGYSHVVDGRFKGGFITRCYGRPDEETHSIQIELSQTTYMEEAPPWTFLEDRAESVRPALRALVESARDWAWERTKSLAS